MKKIIAFLLIFVLVLPLTMAFAEDASEGDTTTESSGTDTGSASPTPTPGKKSTPTVPPSSAAVKALEPYYATVKTKGSDLNIRNRANQGATVLTKLANGEQLIVTGYTGQWLQVKANGITGFVPSRYVSESLGTVAQAANAQAGYAPSGYMPSGYAQSGYDPTTSTYPNTTYPNTAYPNNTYPNNTYSNNTAMQYYVITNPTDETVTMRTEPSEAAPVKAVFYYGYQLKVLSEINGWCMVLDEAYGETGYIMKDQLQQINSYGYPTSEGDQG